MALQQIRLQLIRLPEIAGVNLFQTAPGSYGFRIIVKAKAGIPTKAIQLVGQIPYEIFQVGKPGRLGDYVGDLGQILIPEFLERSLADQVAPAIEAQFGGIHPNQALNRYVDSVVQKLAKNSARPSWPHRGRVLADPKTVNAFALGNGNVYITAALLRLLGDESELAGVMGHEVGHVSARHMSKNMEAALGVQGLQLLANMVIQKVAGASADQQAIIAKVGSTISELITSGYSRVNESEADDLGLDLSIALGYDPNGIVRVFEKFQTLEKGEPGLGIFFRSHPMARQRVAALRNDINAKYPGRTGQTNQETFLRETAEFNPQRPPEVVEWIPRWLRDKFPALGTTLRNIRARDIATALSVTAATIGIVKNIRQWKRR